MKQQNYKLHHSDCVQNISQDFHIDRVPRQFNNFTCKKTAECHEIRTSIALLFKSKKSIDYVDLVVSCQKRRNCKGTTSVTSTWNENRSPKLLTNVTCPSNTEPMVMKIPVFYHISGHTRYAYEDIVYDCMCNCPISGR